jgi:hypothetical protein
MVGSFRPAYHLLPLEVIYDSNFSIYHFNIVLGVYYLKYFTVNTHCVWAGGTFFPVVPLCQFFGYGGK